MNHEVHEGSDAPDPERPGERGASRPDTPRPPPAATPLDHPFFLPALFLAGTLWFGYDVLFDPEVMTEHPWFNLGGLAVCLLGTVYYGVQGVREQRALAEQARSREGDPPDD